MSEIQLRPYRLEDAEVLHEAILESVREISPWMAWCHPNYSLQEARSWIELTLAGREAGTMYDFAIWSDNEYVGACGINQIQPDNRVANLGYWIRSSRAGEGIAPRAVRWLLDWAMTHTDLNRIEIVAAVENTRSQRVAEKVNATREAVLAQRLMANGRPSDAVVYCVLRTDERQRPSSP